MIRKLVLAALVLSASPPDRLSAQDTSFVDRGVRIGIVYRPGVRPGMVMLPRRAAAPDSVRTILLRDLDYSDRFELITLPGGDSIRIAGGGAARAPVAGGTGGGGAAPGRRRGSITRCTRRWAPTSRSTSRSPATPRP